MTETATQQAPVPGWYQDPQGQGLRWWDGSGWTTHVQQSTPPAPEPAVAAAPQAQPVQAAPAAVQQPAGAPPSVASSPSTGMKTTGADKKSSGSLSDKLNDNPVPVLLVLAAVLIVMVVLFVL
jgi:uncharacterized protein DUF2510